MSTREWAWGEYGYEHDWDVLVLIDNSIHQKLSWNLAYAGQMTYSNPYPTTLNLFTNDWVEIGFDWYSNAGSLPYLGLRRQATPNEVETC